MNRVPHTLFEEARDAAVLYIAFALLAVLYVTALVIELVTRHRSKDLDSR